MDKGGGKTVGKFMQKMKKLCKFPWQLNNK